MTPARPDLEVLICTIGAEGIRRVAASQRPEIPGVLYLVYWQLPDGDLPVPDELRNRHDTIVIKSASRGISVNRNRALSGCGGNGGTTDNGGSSDNGGASADSGKVMKTISEIDAAALKGTTVTLYTHMGNRVLGEEKKDENDQSK